MPQVTSWDLPTTIQNMATSVQQKAKVLVDFTVGSVTRAVVEATAQVVIWLEGLILLLLQATRAATSSGADLDSWMLDYGLTRLAATASTGQVTFSRFTSTYQAVIPVGTVIQTADGTQQFTVIADSNQAAYSAALGGYVIAAGIASAVATVQAVNTSSVTNVLANTITTLTQAVQYVDTVTNAAAFTNGADAETDGAFRARFITYINGLSKATKTAVGNAILAVKQGLSYVLVENQTYGGLSQPGYFYAVVDDGTGSPPSTLLSSVSNAIDAVRPFCSTFAVFAPVVVTANVAMTITTAAGYSHSAVVALVQTALQSYINSLTIGQTLSFTRLAQVAYDASPGVTNVTGATLNSGTADLTATNQQIVKYGTVTVA
ncbi:baseplate J/gp47 family protein [Cupriavidus sp. CV2]|uniref:baseplate J/gp47 family protein n=1 Tax=Cupriavidus ulmosensis TaxID=3065913 RepID=UPI00296AE373|nr:baseplate J/gp47 family protein [Cupriavidus sp. CV2]MDW3683118.1 baseplate J/gp47 family protein [Cupriavidus sp. CV2]